MQNNRKKVIIIGFDGGTFRLIDPWINNGKLPNLKILVQEGFSGILKSTPYPNSAPAWVSCLTGVNPGKHGIFGFGVRADNNYQLDFANATYVQAKTLGEYLGEAGRRTIMMNVPLTYPPVPIEGIVVTGMETPGKESNFTHPPEFKEELNRLVPDYIIEVPHYQYIGKGEKEKEQLYLMYQKSINEREKLLLYLLQKEQWDLFMVVFSELDRIQHYFWADMDPSHPGYAARAPEDFKLALLNTYQRLDQAIGKILKTITNRKNISIFVVSDHGFGPSLYDFYLNIWLLKNGFLYLYPRMIGKLKYFLRRYTPLGAFADMLNNFLSQHFHLKSINPGMWRKHGVQGLIPANLIDWAKTRAFGDEGGIRLNLKGREPQGIVEPGKEAAELKATLANELAQIQNKRTGEPVYKIILSKEEAFWGPYLEGAPDLITCMNCGEQRSLVNVNRFLSDSKVTTGTHDMNGIFLAMGPGLRRERSLKPVSIYDVAPAVLAYLGVPIPKDMDGDGLKIFEEEFIDESGIKRKGSVFKLGKRESPFSNSEQEQLEQKLKNLGYF